MKLLHLKRSVRRQTAHLSDESLAIQAKDGEDEAWMVLLERYSDRIYTRALHYCRTGYVWASERDVQDEVSDLYLFIVTHIKAALQSYKGRAMFAHWFNSILYNRKQILSNYLSEKYPGRGDIRLPKVMQGQSETDQAIYRRLVWAWPVQRIARALGMNEEECEERCGVILELLKVQSPRVYQRIVTNRDAAARPVSLDALTEGEHQTGGETPDSRPLPDAALDEKTLIQTIRAALQRLPSQQLRLLTLRYSSPEERTMADLVDLYNNLGLEPSLSENQAEYQLQLAYDALWKAVEETFTERISTRDAALKRRAIRAMLTQWGVEDLLEENFWE